MQSARKNIGDVSHDLFDFVGSDLFASRTFIAAAVIALPIVGRDAIT